MSTATLAAPIDRYNVKAMEIRGGNEAAHDRLTVAGFEVYTYSQPHNGAPEGGDVRFVCTCAMGQIVRFTLADTAGHGAEAGEMASHLKAMVRKHINTPNPTKFASQLNKELGRMAKGGKFATAVISTYVSTTDHLIVCNAGHPRQLLFHAPTADATKDHPRRWELFDQNSSCTIAPENAKRTGVSNLPLGIIQQTNYPQFATRLVEGDMLILYTDALIEASNSAGEHLGEEGLLDIVRRLDMTAMRPDEIGPAIMDAVATFRGGRPADDDLTLIVLYHTGTNPPGGAMAYVKAIGRIVGLVH